MSQTNMINLLTLVSMGLGILAAVGWALLREARKRLAVAESRMAILEGHRGPSGETDRPALAGDLDELHAQLDRLMEGQEFLARVLTQRQVNSPSPEPTDPTLPH